MNACGTHQSLQDDDCVRRLNRGLSVCLAMYMSHAKTSKIKKLSRPAHSVAAEAVAVLTLVVCETSARGMPVSRSSASSEVRAAGGLGPIQSRKSCPVGAQDRCSACTELCRV